MDAGWWVKRKRRGRQRLLLLAGISAAGWLLAAIVTPAGCGSDSEGERAQGQLGVTGTHCELGTSGTSSGASIATNATDCASGMCLSLSSGQAGGSQTLCTSTCKDDSDCPKATSGCAGGFTCAAAFAVGGLSCCPLCVCKASFGDRGSSIERACSGRTPRCPSL